MNKLFIISLNLIDREECQLVMFSSIVSNQEEALGAAIYQAEKQFGTRYNVENFVVQELDEKLLEKAGYTKTESK